MRRWTLFVDEGAGAVERELPTRPTPIGGWIVVVGTPTLTLAPDGREAEVIALRAWRGDVAAGTMLLAPLTPGGTTHFSQSAPLHLQVRGGPTIALVLGCCDEPDPAAAAS